uniref:Si:dkey-19b23.7 n=1 Tax=Hippocampus comes TaxID=109280 RepID=A0A3Q2YUC1_HIPCM
MSITTRSTIRSHRRKLQHFLADLALLGSLQGFKYFQPWLRGKEELLLTVVNEDLVSHLQQCFSIFFEPSGTVFENHCWKIVPLTVTARQPKMMPSSFLRTFYFVLREPSSEEHLLPASPSEREMAVPEVNCTLFLLAGYMKYGRPHAWIRSNHERLVSIRGTDSMVRDTPLKLKSITDWQAGGIRVWDVVSELVSLCTVPFPSNPFALDMRYIQSLPVSERFLATGALLNFLETYATIVTDVCSPVLEEVKPLRRLHVQTLLELQRLKKTSAEQDVDIAECVS